jgi:signal transduction histidine kinase
MVFYRLKLKKPLAILQSGAERIKRQDLDFTIEKCADDELGALCTAFETMRFELLKSNRELWRQMEERKRLNAAFSHDLRNPVTVLKGSAAILRKGLNNSLLTEETAGENISLIYQYAGRIENYIEAMTSAQKLEDLKFNPGPAAWSALAKELENSLSILSAHTGKKIQFICNGADKEIKIDKYIVHNTAENLVSNALRYAREKVIVVFSCDDEKIVINVSDDGIGFSSAILNKGAVPFLRDDTTEQGGHFGMGLYICRLLCEKHGGGLILENGSDGAEVTATFNL